ncbi:retrovirus-related pol polyprotein from transposon TNT 1-94 [Tanacetum coccineum]
MSILTHGYWCNDIHDDQNDVECDDEHVALANLIANLKLDVDENKKIQKQLKKQMQTLDSRGECDVLHKSFLKQTEFDPICHVFIRSLILLLIVQLILFIVDSGCTKHMTGNLSLLCNFVEKYLGTVHFGNDQFAPILGYGDLVQGNITIKRVYYVEGLNHNLFSVGQFCDADLEVAFRKSTTLHQLQSCLMANALQLKTWLWSSKELSNLNFDYINLLSKKDVVIGLLKLKTVKFASYGLMWSNAGCKDKWEEKRNIILVFGRTDYSRYAWTLFLRSNDETPEVLKDFLTMIQRNLQAPVISVRTNRGTEFLNKTLTAFFKEEGIEHQTSTPRTPEQNGVVERRNRTLVEAARTMLSASKLPLFFWAEAIITACYTQNRSIIIPTHEKTAYHIINDKKPSIKHLHIFGCTCYLIRDGENLDKMKEKGDPCILVGYSTQSKGYRVYNKRTRLIVESIHLRFGEIKEMSETYVANDTSGLVPQRQKASDYDNLDPALELQNVSPSADTTVPSQQELDLLFGPLYDEFFNAGTSRVNKSSSPTDDSAKQETLPSTNIHPTTEPSTPTKVDAEENNDNQAEFTNPFYKVYRLRKALYGLKHAPRAWYDELSKFLISKGFTKGDKLVSWMSKKQDCTAMSSAEAEYVALSASCAQVMWMRTQLKDYGFNYNKIPLYCDSQSAIAISCNPVQHSRTKHIHTRYHFIKEQVENGIIELYFVRTEYQLADMFTKALPEDRFQYLVRRIGMRCLTPAELEVLTNESA